MKAIGKNVVIEKIEEEIKTESGLLLSNEDAQSFRYQKGKIILPGSECCHLKKDEKLLYLSNQRRYRNDYSGERCRCCLINSFILIIASRYLLSE